MQAFARTGLGKRMREGENYPWTTTLQQEQLLGKSAQRELYRARLPAEDTNRKQSGFDNFALPSKAKANNGRSLLRVHPRGEASKPGMRVGAWLMVMASHHGGLDDVRN